MEGNLFCLVKNKDLSNILKTNIINNIYYDDIDIDLLNRVFRYGHKLTTEDLLEIEDIITKSNAILKDILDFLILTNAINKKIIEIEVQKEILKEYYNNKLSYFDLLFLTYNNERKIKGVINQNLNNEYGLFVNGRKHRVTFNNLHSKDIDLKTILFRKKYVFITNLYENTIYILSFNKGVNKFKKFKNVYYEKLRNLQREN